MPVYMIGGGSHDAPFNRTFFNVTLGDLLQQGKREGDQRLTLFLTDGTTFDVCSIEQLADSYLVVRAYRGGEDACDLSVNLLPYGLIYRIELAPKEGADGKRLGFHWAPAVRSRTSVRRK
jgi:hypothetical protein